MSDCPSVSLVSGEGKAGNRILTAARRAGISIQFLPTENPGVVELLSPVAGITQGRVTVDYLVNAIVGPSPFNGMIPPLRAITSDPTVTMNETSRTFYASVDTAGDKDETAVSVFEHDGNGNYRMVDTRPAELRPPPEHADKRLHWVSDPFGQRCVWEWVVGKWFIPGVADLLEPSCEDLPTYRYLGPAEWHEPIPKSSDSVIFAALRSLHQPRATAPRRDPDLAEDIAVEVMRAIAPPTGKSGILDMPIPDTIEQAVRERDGWIESAAMFHRNEEYYRGIVDEIGAMLGPDAYTDDDGVVHTTVLRGKVIELVRVRLEATPQCLEQLAKRFSTDTDPLVTSEMIAAAMDCWRGPLSGSSLCVAIYRAMRALEPVTAAPAPAEPEPLGPHLTALRGLP